MHHDFLDRYSRSEGPFQHISAAIKILVAMGIVLAVIAVPIRLSWLFIIIAAVLIALAMMSKIPKFFLLKRLLLLEPFVFGIAILAFFQENGAIVFVSIVIRSTLSLLTILLLTNTTPFAEVLQVLRKYHFSPLFVTVLALMYRYLFVLIDEVERMQRARRSRLFQRNRLQLWRMLSTMIGQLFVRSSERAERIYAAMCARGWK
jgi:cobalt/nickel transport system permease protein